MLQSAPYAALLLVGICCWLQFTNGIKIYFESFEQTYGEDWMWCDLRVRKFNRTTTVLNGTMHVYRETSNDLVFHVELFYSRLGNQQYNYYPAKLPTAGVCDFIKNVRENYPSLADLIVNLPEKNECPISVREMYMFDQEVPEFKVVPMHLVRQGLWKGVVRCYFHSEMVISYTVVFKAAD